MPKQRRKRERQKMNEMRFFDPALRSAIMFTDNQTQEYTELVRSAEEAEEKILLWEMFHDEGEITKFNGYRRRLLSGLAKEGKKRDRSGKTKQFSERLTRVLKTVTEKNPLAGALLGSAVNEIATINVVEGVANLSLEELIKKINSTEAKLGILSAYEYQRNLDLLFRMAWIRTAREFENVAAAVPSEKEIENLHEEVRYVDVEVVGNTQGIMTMGSEQVGIHFGINEEMSANEICRVIFSRGDTIIGQFALSRLTGSLASLWDPLASTRESVFGAVASPQIHDLLYHAALQHFKVCVGNGSIHIQELNSVESKSYFHEDVQDSVESTAEVVVDIPIQPALDFLSSESVDQAKLMEVPNKKKSKERWGKLVYRRMVSTLLRCPGVKVISHNKHPKIVFIAADGSRQVSTITNPHKGDSTNSCKRVLDQLQQKGFDINIFWENFK